ncbi:CD2-associated protein isoform X1 [Gadus macrocephalus]|uniref:CD2-associated protein isoform X1 n=1 Tax=Gadus macrocephalus TaxID=80720 RepID=UPI0028CB1E39|nr:CD2-associated protein isoform X1 [Gadus macrocephalus]
MEVLVEYEYEALHEDELTLRPGDVIVGVRRVEEEGGWMEGELDGRRGLFPDNFVKELKKEEKAEAKVEAKVEVKAEAKVEAKVEAKAELCQARRREKQPGTVANMVQRMSHIPMGGFQPHGQASKKKPRPRQCRVLYDYAPQNQDELELAVGELVDINEEVEEGWWSGSVNGRSGLFPSNFVKELEDEETAETASATDEIDGKEVLDPSSPGPGNGVVVPPKKVLGFGFGDIFREGSVKLRTRPHSPDKEERRDKPIPSLPSVGKPGSAPAAPPPPADSRAQEYCKVTYAFDSTNEDELSLKEDDIIHILSKDTGEPGWWRGEFNGKSGVFPDNFVAMVTDADKEDPAVRASMTPPSSSSSSSSKQEPEEKPKKPPPPSKHTALRPDIPNTDRKPQFARSEDRVDLKPSKPAAPLVSKKPLPLPLKHRLSGAPPKRPDKPLTSMTSSPALTPSTAVTPGTPPPTVTKHNGEVGSLRPKSDLEPLVFPKPRTTSGDWAEKSPESDLMSFDALSASSEKLSHLTANRPKMPGRRLPGHAGGQANKEVEEEQEETKPKLSDTKKPSMSSIAGPPAGFLKPSSATTESRGGGGAAPWADAPSLASPRREAPPRGRLEAEDLGSQMEEMRNQMRDLLMSVDLIKNQQTKEMALLRAELDEERLKRLTLQMEIEKLKRAVQLT